MTLNVQSTLIEHKVDITSEHYSISVCKRINEPKASIQSSKTKLTNCASDKLEIIGKCALHCMGKSLNFFVSQEDQPAIISSFARTTGCIKKNGAHLLCQIISKLLKLIAQFWTCFKPRSILFRTSRNSYFYSQ